MRLTVMSAALLVTGLASAATPVDGVYTSVFGGYTYLPDNMSNNAFGFYRNHAAYNSGYNAGGRLGYQSNPMRYEAEYTYLSTNTEYFYLNGIRQTGVTGYSSANLLMANVYYDFPDMLPAISPFLGVGIGYAYVQSSLNSTGPLGITSFKASDNEFAYQGTAGITYNFAEHYAMNLAYRYVATSSSDQLGKVFQAHMANVGVVYHFDQGNYK